VASNTGNSDDNDDNKKPLLKRVKRVTVILPPKNLSENKNSNNH